MKEGNKSYKKAKVGSFLEYNNGRVNAITGFKQKFLRSTSSKRIKYQKLNFNSKKKFKIEKKVKAKIKREKIKFSR